MPIEYEIDRKKGVIRTRCVGPTTLVEVMEHFHTLHGDPALPPRIDVLLDLCEMSSVPEREQIRAIVSQVKTLGSELRWGLLAIVAPSDLLFGMSRVFGIFVEESFANVGVFRRPSEAEAWLASQRAGR